MSRKKKAASRINHRIIMGDSRSMPELEDNSIHLVVTSPPVWNPRAWAKSGNIGQLRKLDSYVNSLTLVWQECFRVLHPGCILCLHISRDLIRAPLNKKENTLLAALLETACMSAGFIRESEIIWIRETAQEKNDEPAPPPLLPRSGEIDTRHDTVLIFSKPGQAPRPADHIAAKSGFSDREWKRLFISNWTFPDIKEKKTWYPFPEEMPRRLIRMYSFMGETVLDPFLGGGTTSAAARDTGRASVGYEIDSLLKNTINDRLSAGQTAKNLSFEQQQKPKKSDLDSRMGKITDAGSPQKKSEHKKTAAPEKTQPKPEPPATSSVAEIYGVDMVRLSDNRDIRLLGVQAPGAFFSRNRGLYRQALTFMNTTLRDKPLTPRRPEKVKGAGFSSNSFYLVLPDGATVNELLIKTGYALSDRSIQHEMRSRFDTAENSARHNNLGIWALGKTDSPRPHDDK